MLCGGGQVSVSPRTAELYMAVEVLTRIAFMMRDCECESLSVEFHATRDVLPAHQGPESKTGGSFGERRGEAR